MNHYSLRFLLVTLAFGFLSCTESAPSGPDSGDGATLAKHKPGHGGGGPGGGGEESVNWAFAFRAPKSDQIVQLTIDGGSWTKVTKKGQSKVRPVYSPDGSLIAYVKYIDQNSGGPNEAQIHVVRADGSGDQMVYTTAGGGPGPFHAEGLDWVDDGTNGTLVFMGYLEMYSLDVTTGAVTPVGVDPVTDWLHTFAVSSDMELLRAGFQGFVAFSAIVDGVSNGWDLFVAPLIPGAGGGYVADVTSMQQLDLADRNGGQRFPAFSPDASQIAFVEAVSLHSGDELMLVSFDPIAGTFNGAPSSVAVLTIHHHPAWSPDGTRLAISGDGCPESGGNAKTDLYVIDAAAGAVPTAVTCNTSSGIFGEDPWHPDWNPAWVADS